MLNSLGLASLVEPDDFRSFKVVVSRHVASLESAVARFGRLDDGHNVWVSQEWLIQEGRPADPTWRDGLGQMIAYAERLGWLNLQTGAIRAHLEWMPD